MGLKYQPGETAVFVDDVVNCGGPLDRFAVDSNKAAMAGKPCVIVVVQDVPGKSIGVYFKEAFQGGHTLDGLVDKGHGAWVMADDLYTSDEHDAHVAEHAKFAKDRDAAQAIVEQYKAQK